MLNIAVCDDEQIYRDEAVRLLNEFYDMQSEAAVKIVPFGSGDDLLEYVDDNGPFDLYLFDIVMPEIRGIELGKKVAAMNPNSLIVYLTQSKDYAFEAYEVNPFGYIIKGDKEKLFSLLRRATKLLCERNEKSVSVKTAEGIEKLLLDEILFVEFVDRRCLYHMRGGETVLATQQRASFSEIMLPILRDTRFCMCGASFVLNLHHVMAIDKEAVRMRGLKEPVFVPKTARSSVLKKWLDYWMEGDMR